MPLAAAALIGLLGACGDTSDKTDAVTPTAGTFAPSGVTAGSSAPSGALAGTTSVPPVTTGTSGTGARPPTTPSGGAGTSAAQPGDVSNGAAPAAGVIPCNVAQVLATNCQNCHSATPIGGAPMAMVTYADLHKPAPTQPAMKVYQLAKLRIHDKMRPMPPTTQLTPPDVSALDTWFDGGALTGPAADANCMITKPPVGPVGSVDGSTGPLVAGPGETCYEFKTHNSTSTVDGTPYNIGDGEHYEQFYFDVPWPKDSVATSYATVSDNAQVLHHWLLFSTDENEQHGFHKTVPLPTLIGTNPILLAGWAVGGPTLVAPKDVGFELPDPGKQINVQWHFYNSTGMPQKDASSVQICTVPKAMRPHVGAVSWLGTEDLGGNVWFGGAGMPPHMESTFKTTCTPGRRGLAATESIHIIGFEPHMHKIGTRMKTTVNKMDGTKVDIFDKPFSFGNETHYFQDYELKPGETLTTACTFNNTSDRGVPFGESSDTEMCYQFTFHWPAHSLANGAPSLLGVTDTCWGPNHQ